MPKLLACLFSLFLFLPLAFSQQNINSNPYYYSHWCGHGEFRFLDDSECEKVFPSTFSRTFSCPTTHIHKEGYHSERDINEVYVNTSLSDIAELQDENVNVVMILVDRNSDGLKYKYYSNGGHDIPHETWSSSKIFSIAAAAVRLENECSRAGLDRHTTGKHGSTPLGDLASIVCSYDTTAGYTSNSLAKYFAAVANTTRLDSLIKTWLSRPDESMGGSYGEPVPSDLEYTFALDGEKGEGCGVAGDIVLPDDNSLSLLSMAELTRRLVLHREIPEEHRFPFVSWEDVEDILYGAESSLLFPGLQWGGMSSDISIFLQSGLNMTDIEQRSDGQWRILSKLGCGYSYSRYVGEVTYNSYACLPDLTTEGNANGVEMILSARASIPQDTTAKQAVALAQSAVAAVVQRVMDGALA